MADIIPGANGIPPLPISYYENFLESLARIVSKLLTDQETETVISSIRSFQERLKRVSSQNLSRLSMEISAAENPSPGLCRHEGKTCTQNCTRGFIKTFTVAFAVKYLIGVLPTLLSGKILKRPGVLKQMAGRDTACFALFLSTFISSYKGILCAMRRYRKTKDRKSDRLNAFVAGSLAGLALAFDRDKRRRQSIMLYLFTRALQFSGAWLMKHWAIKRKENHPGEKRWDDCFAEFIQRFSGVGVMMLANAQIIYAFLFNHDTLPRSFFAFLLTHASFKKYYDGMAARIAEAVGVTVHQLVEDGISIKVPEGVTSQDFISQYVSPNIASSIHPKLHHKYIMCSIQHPLTSSCTIDKFGLFKDEFLRSLKLYVPLNVIMLAVFRSKQMRIDPQTVLQKFSISCLRSALFLTMYVVMGLSTPCTLRRVTGRDAPWIYAATGAVAGSMVAIEAPGRQLELGLYCLPRALESFWKTLLKSGKVRNIPHGDILLFMTSMGTLMTLYQNEKDTINSHYLSVMTRFFGQN
ncbi:uncharacterized protein B0P05DRAFT_554256 [Gilbertella persicaria]|uniref:uncharacterized protein n=1 Tax=Gilbertella persicaria TaxID=101096 RepID=UPI002220059C|nr:uncharacterized protein B0P05DRAFT_554256 [Gilbertella persicaria]KAI8064784.1 hypothetical protein B0P05DRAFT_554256 [Gilbertella persicaria]